MKTMLFVIGALFLLQLGLRAEARTIHETYPVTKFGAKADGRTMDTSAVQKAIDACSEAGGGTVYFGPGVYLCGSLHLKNGVCLRLDAGATIKGSPDDADYDKLEELGFRNDSDKETAGFHFALIWAEDVHHIGIVGEGTIDSNRTKRRGPKPIALKRCAHVDIKGIRIVNSPNYNISLLGTDYVNIDGVTILNSYCDGIDPDACHNVRIANCHIEARDDAIVPKTSFTLGEHRSCENITVTNCFLATNANGFKLGTESGGDFKHIAVSNCVMTGLKGVDHATSGISLESVDGANVDGVAISNISMFDARTPIFIRLGARLRDNAPAPGSIRNVVIDNVVALNASVASTITGIPGHYPEGIVLSNIRLNYNGADAAMKPGQTVPELEKEYPDADMFEALPVYGLFVRHVKDLTMARVQLLYGDAFWRLPEKSTWKKQGIDWGTPDGIPKPSEPGDPGTAMLLDDVQGANIDALKTRASGGDSVIKLVNVQDLLFHGSRAPEKTKVYLEILGAQTRNIDLRDNILRDAETPITYASDVPQKAVSVDSK